MMKSQMQEINLDVEKLKKLLNHLNVKSVKELIILSLDESGKLYYQTKTEPAITIDNINKEIELWNFGLTC